MATIQERLGDYVGDVSVTNPDGLEDYLWAAMSEVIKALPSEMVIPLLAQTAVNSGTTALVDNDIVLNVQYSSTGPPCQFVSEDVYRQATNSTATIYQPSSLDPIYTVVPNAGGSAPELLVSPAPTAAIAYKFPKDSTAINAAMPGTIPHEAHEAVIILVAIKVLQYRMAKARADEDADIVNMIGAEVQGLQALYQREMSSLVGDPNKGA